MDRDFWEITDKITKKTLEKEYLDFNMALDELNFRNVKVENGGWFGEKLDKNSLNYLRLHGSKSLAEEKKVLKDIKIQQNDVSPFKSLEVLKETLLCNGGSLFFTRRVKNLEQMIIENYYLSDRQKLVIEIERFQIQHKERASMYDSLKKSIKDQIKLLCDDDSLKNRRELMQFGTRRNKHNVKELVAINGELYSLKEKLMEMYKKREEAHQMRLELEKLYHTIRHYYKHCSFINKVSQLAEEKYVAALDGMSSLEVEKFILEWNKNKAFRDDYEKKILKSLERG